MNGNNKKMTKKVDFQIGKNESKTYYRLIKKTGGPQAAFWVCCEKKKKKATPLSGNIW